MSINPETLAGELEILADRFQGRKLMDVTLDRYAEYLEQHLSEEDFLHAARIIFNRDTYFPSPQRFVEVIHGNARELAAEAWADIQAAIKEGSTDLDFLSPAGRAALKAAGGWQAVYAAPSEIALDRARRAFLEAFDLTARRDGPKALEAPLIDVLDLQVFGRGGS